MEIVEAVELCLKLTGFGARWVRAPLEPGTGSVQYVEPYEMTLAILRDLCNLSSLLSETKRSDGTLEYDMRCDSASSSIKLRSDKRGLLCGLMKSRADIIHIFRSNNFSGLNLEL